MMINYTEREIGPFHCVQFEEDIESQHLAEIEALMQDVVNRGIRRLIVAFQRSIRIDVGFSLPLVRLSNFLKENGGMLILYETPTSFEFVLRLGKLCENIEFKMLDDNITTSSRKS